MRRTSVPRLFLTSAVFVIAFLGIGACAASAAAPDRITSAVSENSRVAIPNSVHPKTRLATDLGPASANTRLQAMTLRFSMTAAQQAALDQLLVDLQDPSSPRYRQWLTPAQFATQFGLGSADIAKVTAWLTSQGFTVTGVAHGGTFVTFDGTVAQAQTAFATSIHNLSVNGETHFANVTDAAVPNAFASVVSGITGLHDFKLKPRVQASVVRPQYTSSVSGSHYIAPGDLYTIYDMNPLLTNSINGAGITIAVTGQVDINLADVTAFRNASGLTTNLPTIVTEGADPGVANNCSSATSSNCPSPNLDDLSEASIDVEWAGAAAPSASILYVNGANVFSNSMTQAIDLNLAPIVTTSYGACEAAWGSMEILTLNALFKQANAQGQTILAPSGDLGATDCDAGSSAIEGLAVDFPASSPYVTAMGGTMFSEGTATGATNYWSANNGATGGSALSYIPEAVWNEDVSGSSFSAGGGGVSAFFTKPAWQVETGPPGLTTLVPPDSSRDVPDLSLNAASGHDPFLYCYNVAAGTSCTSGYRLANNNLTVAGGTSFDSQIFGGMLALIEQKIGSRIGNANPTIYALANKTAYYNTTGTSAFHDVTLGDNKNPCSAGTPNCLNGGSIGYSASVGYDLATGWGSVDLYNLASDWNLVTPLGAVSPAPNISSTTIAASPASVVATATVTLTATVTSATSGVTATPTGTVQFLVNNAPAGTPVTLSSSGAATYPFVTSCSTLGQQNVSASYSGDANYQGSKGPILASGQAGASGGAAVASNGSVVTTPLIVTVSTGTCPDFSIAGPTSAVAVAPGGTPIATITMAPLNNFTGTVVFSATAVSNTAYLPGFTFSPASVSIGPTASATTTVTLTGIIADLRIPTGPGKVDSGTMFARQTLPRTSWYAAGSGVTIASLLLLTLPRKRRLGGLLLVALSFAIVGGATGCGSNTVTASTSTNPYAGTYLVTVIGTYTSSTSIVTTHSTTVSFQVQ